MCVRRAEDGQWYATCYECAKHEAGGSFDEATFRDYLRHKLGWQTIRVQSRFVKVCKTCYEERTYW